MTSIHQDNRYDAIVIGSGIGGLTTASLLAQIKKMRVLVLERHFKLGGFTHTFSRKGYTWDVGLHYVGEMEPGSQTRALMDLVTGHGVAWQRMPDTIEHVIFPDFSFDIASNAAQFKSDLVARFPGEAHAIHRYFRDIHRVAIWLTRYAAGNLAPKVIAQLIALPGRSTALQTTKMYLDRNFSDPQLKALLGAQWFDYGLPPSQSAFAIHCLIAHHYLNGAYYPEGGADKIVESIKPIIEAAGGDCLVNQTVSEIIVREGRAVGVRVNQHNGKGATEFYAPLIISDAGMVTTYLDLLPRSLNLPQVQSLQAMQPSMSTASIYIGFKTNPATLGFRGENHWVYEGYDHDAMNADNSQLLEGHAGFGYLSFASLKDPKAHKHTAQIIAPIDYNSFAQWRERAWKRRGADYEALKTIIANGLLDLAERHYPGFRALVDYYEVSTPLTVEGFTGNRSGGIYGLPSTPERFRQAGNRVRTPIDGLLLTGADTVTLGIVGCMMSGVMTAASQLGPLGFFKINGLAQQNTDQSSAAVNHESSPI